MSSDSEELVLHNDEAQDDSEADSLEEAVLDVDSDEESDEDDEETANERYKALAKQAKALEAKLRASRGDDESESSEEGSGDEEDARDRRWGKASAYYAADNVDLEVGWQKGGGEGGKGGCVRT